MVERITQRVLGAAGRATTGARSPIDQRPRLRSVFEEHSPFVCRSLRRLGVSDADLDDALQEVFLVVHRRLSGYDERGRLRSWLYSICAHIALAQRRKVSRRRETLTAEPPEATVTEQPHDGLEAAESLALGHRLLDLLRPEQREVFVLYEVEELSMREIADALRCPLQTAYSRLHAARARVLEELTRLRGEEAKP